MCDLTRSKAKYELTGTHDIDKGVCGVFVAWLYGLKVGFICTIMQYGTAQCDVAVIAYLVLFGYLSYGYALSIYHMRRGKNPPEKCYVCQCYDYALNRDRCVFFKLYIYIYKDFFSLV